MTQSGESISPRWGPWPVSDLFPKISTADCAWIADLLEIDAIRSERVAPEASRETSAARRGIAQLLRALATGDVVLVDKGNSDA